MKQVYINTFMCLHYDCPCLGGVCVNPKEPVLERFCPKLSGCLEEFILKRLKECELADWTYETNVRRVLANPEAYPRMYSGDGQHYMPMFPKWKKKKMLNIRKITFNEACAALRRHEEGLPQEIEVLEV